MSSVDSSSLSSEFLVTHEDGNLCHPCKQYAELESRLAEAKKQLADAESLVALLEPGYTKFRYARGVAHDWLVSTLPLETVSYIFKIYVKMHEDICDDGELFPNTPMSSARLYLGAVSHTWRTIAWSLPCLWTTLAIEFNPKRGTDLSSLVKQWLERAGGFPLYIRLYACIGPYNSEYYCQPTNAEEVDFSRVVEAINEFSSQWKRLDLALPCDLLQKVKSSTSNQHTSILQHLRLISVGSTPSNGPPPSNGPTPSNGQSPTQLSVSNITMYGLVDTQLQDLTYFEADGISVTNCLGVIAKAPCLAKCILFDLKGEQPSTSRITKIAVRSLRIESTWPSYSPEALLDGLALPSLKMLDYHSGISHVALRSLFLFLRRSSCPLETLIFQQPQEYCDNYIAHGVVRVLRTVPMLKTLDLKLEYSVKVGRVLKCLCPDTGSADVDGSPFLPDLETLHTVVDHRFSWGILLDIFGSRPLIESGEPILRRKSLKLDLHVRYLRPKEEVGHSEYVDKQTLRGLGNLLAQGIEISITRLDKCFIASSLDYHASRDNVI